MGKPLHMKKIVYLIGASCTVFSCKPPSYSYVPTTLNTAAYSHSGEGHAGVFVGSAGLGAKGGVALTKNINVNIWGATLPSANNDYSSKEAEYSIGVQTNPDRSSVTSFILGLGNGHNEKPRTELSGHFNRGFLQVMQSTIDSKIGSSVRVEGFIGLRVNYLDYTGTNNDKPLNDILYYYEPFFGFNIGGKNVRFELLQGLAMKNTGEWSHGVRVFPWFGHIGLLVKLPKEEKSHRQQVNPWTTPTL